MQEQLVIQHIRNLKEIHHQRQKHQKKDTKNFHHFHKSKVQSPLSINNIDLEPIRSSSNSTANRSNKIANHYFNQMKNKMDSNGMHTFQNSFQNKNQTTKNNNSEKISKDFGQGYKEVGKYLKNMDFPPNDNSVPIKKISSKIDDSVLAESQDTIIKEINTSQGTYQN